MKLIIAGSRTIKVSIEDIAQLIAIHEIKPTHIVSGRAKGIDQCGEAFAKAAGLPILMFPADWDRFGLSAGHRRNAEMGQVADALLLIWDGRSKGSAGMKAIMTSLGKPIFEAISLS